MYTHNPLTTTFSAEFSQNTLRCEPPGPAATAITIIGTSYSCKRGANDTDGWTYLCCCCRPMRAPPDDDSRC